MVGTDHAFYGREEEIKKLTEILQSNGVRLIRIKGRRRIGKTEFVKYVREQLGKNNKIVFYTPVESNIETTIEKLYLDLEGTDKKLMHVALKDNALLTFYPILEQIEEHFEGLIIDEYPRLHRVCHLAYPQLPKEKNPIDDIIKDFIENKVKNPSFKIILMGSEVSVMDELDHGNRPLRGVFTDTLKLEPFKFNELRFFFPKKTFSELLDIFGYSDGIPLYLWMIKDSYKDYFWDWLEDSIRKNRPFWFSEIDSIIEADFSVHGTRYGTILDAIARGHTKPHRIVSACNLKRSGDLTPYLRKLKRANVIVEEFPINDLYRPPGTSHMRNLKNGIYKIADNFISFWFRFIKTTENLPPNRIRQFVQSKYEDYLGIVFERVCREIISLTEGYPYIGRWWGKIDGVAEECDILAFDPDTNEGLLGICKWRNKPQNPKKLIKQAIRYEDHILFNKKYRNMKYKYAIFCKNLEFSIDEFEGREVSCYDEMDLNKFLLNGEFT